MGADVRLQKLGRPIIIIIIIIVVVDMVDGVATTAVSVLLQLRYRLTLGLVAAQCRLEELGLLQYNIHTQAYTLGRYNATWRFGAMAQWLGRRSLAGGLDLCLIYS